MGLTGRNFCPPSTVDRQECGVSVKQRFRRSSLVWLKNLFPILCPELSLVPRTFITVAVLVAPTYLHTTMFVGLTVAVEGSADRASRSLRAGPNFDGKLNAQLGSSKMLHCIDRLATWLMKPCWEIPANLRQIVTSKQVIKMA
jgi:hypothetical protein